MKKHSPTLLERRRKTSSGFTIVEMLLYMALFSMFLVITTNIFLTTVENRLEAQATAGVEQDGRYIMSRLGYDLGRATAVTTPASVGGNGSSLAITLNGVTNTYSLVSGNLQVASGAATYQLNSSETQINSVDFKRIANATVSGTKDTIKMTLGMQSKTVRQSGAEVRNFEVTVGRR